MGNTSTKNPESQDKSELFKKRLDYRLEQGFTPEQAKRLAQLKIEIDEIRLSKNSRDKLKSKNLKLASVEESIHNVRTVRAAKNLASPNFENNEEEVSPDEIAREIAYQIAQGRMSEIPPIENNLTSVSSSHRKAFTPSTDSEIKPEKSPKTENLFNFLLYMALYIAATAVLIPATATALGGTWQAWTMAVILDVSIGVVFSLIFETEKNLVRGILALLCAFLIFISFNTLSAGASHNSATRISEETEGNPEIRVLQERVKRLTEIYVATPIDQLTSRRKTNAALMAEENSLAELRKSLQASPATKAIKELSRADLWVRGVLLLLTMFYMYRIRRALSDPKTVSALMG